MNYWFEAVVKPSLMVFSTLLLARIFVVAGLGNWLASVLSNASRKNFGTLWFFAAFFSAAVLTISFTAYALIPLLEKIEMSQSQKTKIMVETLFAAAAGSAIMPFANIHNVFLALRYHVTLPQFVKSILPMWMVLMLVGFFIARPKEMFLRKKVLFSWKKLNKFDFLIGILALAILTLTFLGAIPSMICFATIAVLSLMVGPIRTVFPRLDRWVFSFAALSFLIFGAVRNILPINPLTTIQSFFGTALVSQVSNNLWITSILSGKADFLGAVWGANVASVGMPWASLSAITFVLVAIKYRVMFDGRVLLRKCITMFLVAVPVTFLTMKLLKTT